jgi:hypothetical protein
MQTNKLLIKRKVFLVVVVFVGVLAILYLGRTPSNDRDWSNDQDLLPYASFNDNTVDVFNIRNFTYTATDVYEIQYYDKTYDIDELSSVDYIVEPFSGIGAAHTFVSFGFENGDYVALSVEIRKEIGETFSPLKGILRNYELMYVIADERDVIKLRTNYRKDDVYLYPVETSKENMKKMFIDMLTRANKLKDEPEFYNTLTNTCTTNIASHINNISPSRIPWDIRLLLPKNSDELAYELGLISNDVPLTELRKKHKINALAEIYSDDPDFSHLIRKTQ